MSESRFLERIREEILRHLSEIVEFEARDPLLRAAFPTVMDVHVSPDARHVKVYVALGDHVEDKRGTIRLFQRDRGFFRSRLAQRLALKHTPELEFVLDETVERAMRLDSLLEEDGDRGSTEHDG